MIKVANKRVLKVVIGVMVLGAAVAIWHYRNEHLKRKNLEEIQCPYNIQITSHRQVTWVQTKENSPSFWLPTHDHANVTIGPKDLLTVIGLGVQIKAIDPLCKFSVFSKTQGLLLSRRNFYGTTEEIEIYRIRVVCK